jgi:hypothetical protein
MAALDRALALAEMDHVPVAIGEDLDLDMTRREEVFLEVDRTVTEGALRLAAAALQR